MICLGGVLVLAGTDGEFYSYQTAGRKPGCIIYFHEKKRRAYIIDVHVALVFPVSSFAVCERSDASNFFCVAGYTAS